MTQLYKFIARPDDVQFLLQGCLKFTPIPELNDPSELLPNVIPEDVHESLSRLRKDGYSDGDMVHLRQQGELLQRLAPNFQAIDVPRTKEEATIVVRSKFYDNFPLLEQLLEQTAAQISSKVGLLCLTRRSDSLPMWAHYAQNAAGLVVEFRDHLDKIFCGDATGILCRPTSVRYERARLGVTFDPQTQDSLFFAKFQDWSYEQEVRVVLPLAECRQQKIGDHQLHLFDVNPKCVARVILGWRMGSISIDRVIALVKSINPDVEVVQAKITKGQVILGDCLYPA